MKGNPEVIATLQKAIPLELALSAQYHLDTVKLKNLGFKGFAGKFDKFGEECEHSVKVISYRLQFFDTNPVYSTGDTAAKTADGLTEMFQGALESEVELTAFYNDAAIQAQAAKDDNTRNMYEHLIKFHEQNHTGKRGGGHIYWLQKKLAQIAKFSENEFALQNV